MFVFSPQQHRGRVRSYGGRRGDVQSVSHTSKKPEDPGGGRGHHPPEPRHQARNLVGSDYQLLGRTLRTGSIFSFSFVSVRAAVGRRMIGERRFSSRRITEKGMSGLALEIKFWMYTLECFLWKLQFLLLGTNVMVLGFGFEVLGFYCCHGVKLS